MVHRWYPEPDAMASVIAVDARELFITGGFRRIAGAPRMHLAVLPLKRGW